MARLLDDLRTLSMAEAGALRAASRDGRSGALVEDASGRFAPMPTSAGVAIDARRRGAPATIEVDPLRLDEVLNLLSNALRHTPSADGAVTRRRPTEGGVRFLGRRHGSGDPRRPLPSLRPVRAIGRPSAAPGLGLAIAKRLVEAHGGTIEAGPAPGGGTPIRFDIPGLRPGVGSIERCPSRSRVSLADDIDSLEPLWVAVDYAHQEAMPELGPYVDDEETWREHRPLYESLFERPNSYPFLGAHRRRACRLRAGLRRAGG